MENSLTNKELRFAVPFSLSFSSNSHSRIVFLKIKLTEILIKLSVKFESEEIFGAVKTFYAVVLCGLLFHLNQQSL
ncbi:hypothetical protein F0562_033751 [Nyssa sinensis]|uniref:Uncharacterized protein n=1 Tax=Nyssa sinensis TaxID=561372 RepID=A0A5J5AFU0_9ASTE|nr:hypothetical protein F0562_033751 [Nyssa sinensis]